MYETLKVERRDRVTWLTLNRPDALNAMNRQLCAQSADFGEGVAAFLEKRPARFRDA